MQVPSLSAHLLGLGAPGFLKRHPSGGNGNALPGSFLSFWPPQRYPPNPETLGEGNSNSLRAHSRPVPLSGSLPPSLRCRRSRPHFWTAERRRWLRVPGLWEGKWGRVSESDWGEALQRSTSARRPALGAVGGATRPGQRRAEPRRGCSFFPLHSSPGLRAKLQARGPGEGRVGEEAARENRRATVSFEKKVGALGGKRKISPPNFSSGKVFPGRFVCANSAGAARDSAAGVAAVPMRLASLLFQPGQLLSLPDRRQMATL